MIVQSTLNHMQQTPIILQSVLTNDSAKSVDFYTCILKANKKSYLVHYFLQAYRIT
jgi:hypothetical protein